MASEVKFETVIKTLKEVSSESVLMITKVRMENHMVYFTCLGHEFQTFSDRILNAGNPLFDHEYIKFLASKENNPEDIEAELLEDEKLKIEQELWFKHKASALKIIFSAALEKLLAEGEEAFLAYIDQFFFIYPEDLAKEIVEKLETAQYGKRS